MVHGGSGETVRGAGPGTGCGRELETGHEHGMALGRAHGEERGMVSYMVRPKVLERVLASASKAVQEIAPLSHN